MSISNLKETGTLTDRFDRVTDYLRISVTDRCNLRCKYCVDGQFPFIPHEQILRYEEIIRFVRIAAGLGVRKIRLTGGEPLVKRGIPFLIKEIESIPGIEDVAITTNGVLLGRMLPELQEAGLRRVNISLDTMKRDRFAYITGVDAFDEVLKSIRASVKSGLNPVKINTVIIQDFNDDEILDFAKLAKTRNVEVRFIEYMPFGNSDLWHSAHIITSTEIEEIIRTKYVITPIPKSQAGPSGPARVFHIKGGVGRVGFISPVSTHICHQCNRIRLTAKGTIKPCLFADEEYDVKSMLRSDTPDDEIRAFIKEAVKAKPERKEEINQIKKCQRNLRHIGG
ncbi:MAG: GTP 3',8-cyclase MoaA [Syntrophobacterales bacterium]|jgi:cyclic pyranopterin phosphate synthase|nr:GTP 3',8-cyclase MoaA [Syntrophobacterales bacterium]